MSTVNTKQKDPTFCCWHEHRNNETKKGPYLYKLTDSHRNGTLSGVSFKMLTMLSFVLRTFDLCASLKSVSFDMIYLYWPKD